ncbi:response regulator [Flavobacterium sp. LS1P28]|uniref:ATP-binding response regulator n=1 Tax=unclassified Flavobacterium TaxID=196869 RepID=UPI000F81F8CF|nr:MULTISPECIES: hybrid sensor histidine kinase/response regulator [unclassified Flavobacterium]RTY78005.1 response regulator [Flavobacterium sp. LS1P28]RTY90645.1 response regulator [Flavobacterium sp. RSP46]
MNILIVEDSNELAIELKEFLSNSGYVCNFANTCEDALDEVNSNDYYIMLLDLGLPDGSGLDVLKSVRKNQSKMAVIVVTARGELDVKINGIPIDNSTSEFKDLYTALNQMIIRIKELFLKEKQFIGNVSHELLTPIAVIKNRFENIIQNQSLNDTAVDKISDSLNTLDSMKKVISNLLLISRIDNKQYQINEMLNFNTIIAKLTGNLEDRIQEKNLVITKNIRHQVYFTGNQTLIKILFSNLFTNAIKYNNRYGNILINDEFIAGKYALTITDTGLGMNNEQASQIFNRFTRIHFYQ